MEQLTYQPATVSGIGHFQMRPDRRHSGDIAAIAPDGRRGRRAHRHLPVEHVQAHPSGRGRSPCRSGDCAAVTPAALEDFVKAAERSEDPAA